MGKLVAFIGTKSAVIVASLLAVTACSPEPGTASANVARDTLPALTSASNLTPPWTAIDTLLPEGYASPRVGTSVASDADTAIVGAPGDGIDATWTAQGAVFVFVRTSTGWMLQQKLIASDGSEGDQFGAAVALSGNTLLVGAPFHDDGATDTGAVYAFERSGGSFGGGRKLPRSERAAASGFGSALSLSGDLAVVAAPLDDELGAEAGAVHVFSRTGTTFGEGQKLLSPDGEAGDGFGGAVSLFGERILIGAPADDAATFNSGSAWVFSRENSVFNATQKLLPDEPVEGEQHLGKYVSLSSDTVLVGGRSTFGTSYAYIFGFANGGWSQTYRTAGNISGVAVSADTAFVATDVVVNEYTRNGSTWSRRTPFLALEAPRSGIESISLSGRTVVLGTPYAQNPGDKSGGAFVYSNEANAWTREGDLLAGQGAGHDLFAAAVALAGDTAFVGAPGDGPFRGPFPGGNLYGTRGSVIVFSKTGAGFTRQEELEPSDPTATRFGTSVAASGETLIVGAPGMSSYAGNPHGVAEVFVRSGDRSIFQQRLVGSATPSDAFGLVVALSGDTALVSDRFDSATPSVFVFVRTGTSWTRQAVLDQDVPGWFSFGSDIAVSGDTAFIGAPNEDTSVSDSSGAVHVFVRTGQTWTRTQKLVPAGLGTRNFFGSAIGLWGDRAFVGDYLADSDTGDDAGAVYTYVRQGSTWVEQQKFVGRATESIFGGRIALSGSQALVGSRNAVHSFSFGASGWSENPFVYPHPPARFSYDFSLALDESSGLALVGDTVHEARGGQLGVVVPYALAGGAGGAGGTGTAGSAGVGGNVVVGGAGSGGNAAGGSSGGRAGASGENAGGEGGGDGPVGGSGAAGPGGESGTGGHGTGGERGGNAGTNTGGLSGDGPGGDPGTGDAGMSGDAHDGSDRSDSGCGCIVLGSRPRDGVEWQLALLLAVTAARPRRRRPRPRSEAALNVTPEGAGLLETA